MRGSARKSAQGSGEWWLVRLGISQPADSVGRRAKVGNVNLSGCGKGDTRIDGCDTDTLLSSLSLMLGCK